VANRQSINTARGLAEVANRQSINTVKGLAEVANRESINTVIGLTVLDLCFETNSPRYH
jgi:hypothetical protein